MDQRTQDPFAGFKADAEKLVAGNLEIHGGEIRIPSRIRFKLTARQWISLYWPSVLSVAAIVISLAAIGMSVLTMLGA